jgi:hypothetical protein
VFVQVSVYVAAAAAVGTVSDLPGVGQRVVSDLSQDVDGLSRTWTDIRAHPCGRSSHRGSRPAPVLVSTAVSVCFSPEVIDVSGRVETRPVTELAYMVREDWGQHGTAMAPQSARIRDWLGDLPLLLVTSDLEKYRDERSADREFVRYLLGEERRPEMVTFADLDELRRPGGAAIACLVALHPFSEQDCETLREVVVAGRAARVFVIVWAPTEVVRTMLDGLGAVDLHTGGAAPAPDPVQLEAAKSMVTEQYNGLASGNGKSAVVQLVRAFAAEGYPLDVESWLRAFFRAGGEFDEAVKVRKLIEELKKGVRHRVKQRYRPDIVSILARRAAGDEEPL